MSREPPPAGLDVPREGGASPATLRAIEATARRAWPALEEERIGGWLLRFAGGVTRRSNSVHAIDDVDDPTAAVAECAARFRARGLAPRFHVHAAVRPPDLEEALAAAGWARELSACVEVAELESFAPGAASAGARTALLARPEAIWFDRFAAWRRLSCAARSGHLALLSRVPPERAFALVSEGDVPRAAGLAVVDGGWVGLFDVVADPAARRRGWGRFVVSELLRWGRDRGAARSYLQVEADNEPALRLYAGLGFHEAYRYGYRLLPPF
jgi:ribosomal protein S18 acetylase RimI-like enzyme